MALNYVTLTLDLVDGQGNPVTEGWASLAPSATLTDTADGLNVTQAPVLARFRNGIPAQVRLLATDNGALAPAGWGWNITFTGVPGAPAGFSFFLPFASGASQNLSAQTPVASVTTMAAYLPLDYPVGANAGYVWTSDANGNGSWQPSGGGGGGLANPMTTLGDMIDGGAAGAATRLPGNTAAGRKFLRSTGTGTTATAPAWDTLVSGDIPALAYDASGAAAAAQAAAQAYADTNKLAKSANLSDLASQQAALDFLAGAVTSGLVLRGNGTHVQLAALQAADVPGTFQSLTFTFGPAGGVPSSGTFAAGAVAVDQNDILRVCISGGTPGTWRRVGYQIYEFFVEDFGAKGDGRLVGDAAMTTGTAILTSATASFTSGDVGKNIVINGALGNSNAPLYTTITGFTNSATVTLGGSATQTISNAAAFCASDDSAAIASAISAASTYAQAGNWKARVIFQSRFYGLATPTVTSAGGALAQQNALVPLPYPNVNGTTQKLNIELIGVGESGEEQYFDSTIPNMTGTALVATVAATGGSPSVVGGPNASTNLSGTWANTKVTIKGITVWCGWNTGFTAFDLRECAACWVDNAGAQIIASNVAGQAPLLTQVPTNTNGTGFNFPANNDNGAGRIICEGYYTGVIVAARTTIGKLMTFDNNTGVLVKTVAATVTHGAWIGYWSVQSCTNAIAPQTSSGSTPLVVDFFDASPSVTNTINDPNGTIPGILNWWNAGATSPAVVAGSVMKIINMRLAAGAMSSPPAPPSSGVASTAVYRDTEVTLSLAGGTMTALTIGGVDQHIPAACVLWKFTVPSGQTFTATYTGTLANDVTVM